MVTLILFIFSASSAADDAVGKLLYVEGKASVISNGQVTEAIKGSPVKNGDTVKTSVGAKAKIYLVNNAVLDLSGNSEILVNQEQGVDLKLGRIRAMIGKQKKNGVVRIRTKSAIMGVRGTEIAIDDTEMLCISGACDIGRDRGGAFMSLGSGEKCVTEGAGPLVISKISEGEVAKKYAAIKTSASKTNYDKDLKDTGSETKFAKKLKEFDSKSSEIEKQVSSRDGDKKITNEELSELLGKAVDDEEVASLNGVFDDDTTTYTLDDEQYVPPPYVVQEEVGMRYVVAVDQVEIAPVD
ncbi:MAG: FecR family protein [Candidatus Poribacteria bacterium]